MGCFLHDVEKGIFHYEVSHIQELIVEEQVLVVGVVVAGLREYEVIAVAIHLSYFVGGTFVIETLGSAGSRSATPAGSS